MCALNKIADLLKFNFKVTLSIFIVYADPLSMRGIWLCGKLPPQGALPRHQPTYQSANG